jgi:hypothetical protein
MINFLSVIYVTGYGNPEAPTLLSLPDART